MTTTTEAAEADHRAALEAGANAYLVKPVSRDQLALYAAAMLGRNIE
jgi:DNA-binding response OmpR family regulator